MGDSTALPIFGEGVTPVAVATGVGTRKRANALDGKTWTRYSISVWSDIAKTAEEKALKHPAMFPAALPKRLIEMFTTPDDQRILDPFMGTGSTLIAAKELGKIGIGFEVNAEYIDLARTRLAQMGLFETPDSAPRLYYADARYMLHFIDADSVDFCVTSPPYWDVLSQRRTADNRPIRDYTEAENDLGRIADYKDFLRALADVFAVVFKTLRHGKYCAVNVMDLRKKDKFYPFHSDLAEHLQRIGFIYDDIIIWDRRAEYSNMRPLGYPYVFRINKAHEYILILKKP